MIKQVINSDEEKALDDLRENGWQIMDGAHFCGDCEMIEIVEGEVEG